MLDPHKLLNKYYTSQEKSHIGVVLIYTSNPVYLIFTKNDYPDYIIRELESKQAEHLFNLCKELYSYVGDQIAEPLSLVKDSDKVYILEKGLSGTPWFQIKETCHDEKDWRHLLQLCSSSIDTFHKNIAKNDQWCSKLLLGNELTDCFKKAVLSKNEVNDNLSAVVNKYTTLLNDLGVLKVNCQHGDYSLNNVLVDNEKLKIIDLEDFGSVSFPLFDEVSLAISIFLQMPNNIDLGLFDIVDECCDQKVKELRYSRDIVYGAFLYTVLFRLGSWSQAEKRFDFRGKLMKILNDFLSKK